MILVTGAAGKTGRAVIRALTDQGKSVRALVRRAGAALGAQETVVGDMRSPATLEEAMAGTDSVYFIAPNMSPDELDMAQIAIVAARAAGVTHFVYHSVLHPQVEKMPHHWQKMRVEEQLFESGLAYTILQPTAYMQNILAQWPQIVEQGSYSVPYGADARLSLIDLKDVAAAAATVIGRSEHVSAVYELAGTRPLSQTEVATTLSQQLNRPVQVKAISLDDWEKQARQAGLGHHQIQALLNMFSYYDRYGLEGNPNVLRWLLGRSPTTLADFTRRVTDTDA
jgi:uncharacterized protein YbjT (DUF2867 family)